MLESHTECVNASFPVDYELRSFFADLSGWAAGSPLLSCRYRTSQEFPQPKGKRVLGHQFFYCKRQKKQIAPNNLYKQCQTEVSFSGVSVLVLTRQPLSLFSSRRDAYSTLRQIPQLGRHGLLDDSLSISSVPIGFMNLHPGLHRPFGHLERRAVAFSGVLSLCLLHTVRTLCRFRCRPLVPIETMYILVWIGHAMSTHPSLMVSCVLPCSKPVRRQLPGPQGTLAIVSVLFCLMGLCSYYIAGQTMSLIASPLPSWTGLSPSMRSTCSCEPSGSCTSCSSTREASLSPASAVRRPVIHSVPRPLPLLLARVDIFYFPCA